MLELNPSLLDSRILEHNFRARVANRRGWLLSPPYRTGRRVTFDAVLTAVRARLAAGTSSTAPAGRCVGTDGSTTCSGARSLA
jgi:hypothetical protein